MQVNIRQNGVNLPSVQHEGQTWVMAPPEGSYEIVLYNNCGMRRLAVPTVDGLSVMTGELGTREGGGYVLEPWQTLVIPGWHRSNSEVARFEFSPNEGSYSNKTGKGTRNTGSIAVAVFDEKPRPQTVVVQQPTVVIREVYPDWWGWYPPPRRIHHYHHTFIPSPHSELIGALNSGSEIHVQNAAHNPDDLVQMFSVQCSAGDDNANVSYTSSATIKGMVDSTVKGMAPSQESHESLADMDLGTAYGERAEMRTSDTSFERAAKRPSLEIVIRYGIRERLAKLGVPVEQAVVSPSSPTPDPFPGASCPAPAGWAG